MNTDNSRTPATQVINREELIITEQINVTQQFGRMPQRHQASYTEKYHYHYLHNEEAPDERED